MSEMEVRFSAQECGLRKISLPFSHSITTGTCLIAFGLVPLYLCGSKPKLFFWNTHLVTFLSILTFDNSVCRMKCELFGLAHKVLKEKVTLCNFISYSSLPYVKTNTIVKIDVSMFLILISFLSLSLNMLFLWFEKRSTYSFALQFKCQRLSKAFLKLAQ